MKEFARTISRACFSGFQGNLPANATTASRVLKISASGNIVEKISITSGWPYTGFGNTFAYTKATPCDNMKLRFSGFNWDSGNLYKCQSHGVSIVEIQDFFIGGVFYVGPDKKHSTKEERSFAIGIARKSNRHIFVIFTVREVNKELLMRPISARYMHKWEIEHYEKTFAKT